MIGALIVAAGLIGYGAGLLTLYGNDWRRRRALTALLSKVREIAWSHRDINPDLSVIITDEIAAYERGRKELA